MTGRRRSEALFIAGPFVLWFRVACVSLGDFIRSCVICLFRKGRVEQVEEKPRGGVSKARRPVVGRLCVLVVLVCSARRRRNARRQLEHVALLGRREPRTAAAGRHQRTTARRALSVLRLLPRRRDHEPEDSLPGRAGVVRRMWKIWFVLLAWIVVVGENTVGYFVVVLSQVTPLASSSRRT